MSVAAELRACEREVKGLDAFNFKAARELVESPDSRHHVGRARDETSPRCVPVQVGYLSVLCALLVHVLYVRQPPCELACPGIRAEVPHRGKVGVSSCNQQPVLRTKRNLANLCISLRVQQGDAFLGLMVQPLAQICLFRCRESRLDLHRDLAVVGC